MSKNEENSEDKPTMIGQISKKYFLEVEHTVPHIQQILFDLQNECYKTWKNTINANISLQKEFLNTSGFDYVVPEVAKSFVANMNDEAARYRAHCNKITVANIESAKKNFKTLNDNAELFVDFNRKMIQYWTSSFYPKQN